MPDTFELELFLSTDGKHTVHVSKITKDNVESAVTQARTLYDKVVEKYGLQPARSFSKGSGQSAPKKEAGTCVVHSAPMFFNKNGKAYHMDRTRQEGDQFCNGKGFPNEGVQGQQGDQW